VPERIDVVKRGGKGAVYRLYGLVPADQTVIGKRCRAVKGALERNVYEHVLPSSDAPAPGYFGSVDDGEWIWLFLEDVGDVRYDPASTDHRRAAARWLGTLHATVDRPRIPDVFPDRGPDHYAHDLQSGLQALPRATAKAERRHGQMLSWLARSLALVDAGWHVVEAICADAPRVFSHNDCLPKNVHVSGSGATLCLAAFDWGGAGWAPLGADLGLLALPSDGPPETEPDYAEYSDAVGRSGSGIGVDALRQVANVGQLFWSLKVVSRGLDEIGQSRHDPGYLLDKLAVYEQTLTRALRFAGIDARQ
jgi:hypothetical protein